MDNAIDENCDGNIEVGIQDVVAHKLQIYPNPNVGEFKIYSDLTLLEYQIFNDQGRLVAQGLLQKEKRVRVNSLSNGIYLLKTTEGSVVFIVEK